MISVDEALERVMAHINPLPAETKPLLDAQGQTLAEDIVAAFALPPWDNSAMDGYAVRAEDVQGATHERPRRLRVCGVAAAGHPFDRAVLPGTAVRIMTGALIPQEADAVVPFEDTSEGMAQSARGGEIAVFQEARLGQHIRRTGEDVRPGQLVLAKGTPLGAAEIGLLAALGHQTVPVTRRPRVAVLATGDELREPGQPLEPGAIYNSNGYAIAAMVAEAGGTPVLLGIARDTRESLLARLNSVGGIDFFITVGGVSAGDFDEVKRILAAEGEIDFWQVRMKPGRPLAFGRLNGVPFLGLPGNPAAAMVAFEVFARPAIRKMLGRRGLGRPVVQAILKDEVLNRDGRRAFVRVRLGREESRLVAWLTGPQGSGMLTSMVGAQGLAIIPEETSLVCAGDEVQVLVLDERSLALTMTVQAPASAKDGSAGDE